MHEHKKKTKTLCCFWRPEISRSNQFIRPVSNDWTACLSTYILARQCSMRLGGYIAKAITKLDAKKIAKAVQLKTVCCYCLIVGEQSCSAANPVNISFVCCCSDLRGTYFIVHIEVLLDTFNLPDSVCVVSEGLILPLPEDLWVRDSCNATLQSDRMTLRHARVLQLLHERRGLVHLFSCGKNSTLLSVFLFQTVPT